MTHSRAFSGGLKLAVAYGLLLVLLMRAAIPAGWMVGPTPEDGRIVIQLCSGRSVLWDMATGASQPVNASADPSLADVAPDQPQPSHGPSDTAACAFSLTPFTERAEPVAPALVQPVQYVSFVPTAPRDVRPVSSHTASRPLPARGPPLFA